MNAELFVALLNPSIDALLAGAFFLVWLNQRTRRYVLNTAIGFAIMGAGSLVQDIGPSLAMSAERLFTNSCFFLGAILICGAIAERAGLRPPYLTWTAIAALSIVPTAWFLFADPNLTARILLINTGLGLIPLLLAVQLWRQPRKFLVDKLIIGAALLSAANYLVRPISIAQMTNGFSIFDDASRALYWSTVQFSQAIIAVVFALVILVAIATDLIRELRREASTDKLTGLLNRRGFETRANQAVNRCADTGAPVCLLIADLDHFKRINDTCGHAAGDEAIAFFGTQIRSLCSEDMIAGRIGGEEFAVLMPGLEINAAHMFAETLRAVCSQHGASSLQNAIALTVSIGVCQGEPCAELSELLGDADHALYEAKEAGRNRVRVYTASGQVSNIRYSA